ncbi:MAG: hypothetical protein KAI47_22005 [Deltaproteobacteria bacterium]|nr:hypothetical protein [Deltaproteobacteria bacterium]
MHQRNHVALIASLTLMAWITSPHLAHAQEAALSPSSGMYVGALIGPSVPIEPSGSALFWFGAEFGISNFNIPVILNPQSGLFKIRATPKYMYDFMVMPKLAVSPFGGLDFTAGFGDITLIQLGLTLGARATYMITPKLGIFAEPATFDLPLFQHLSGGGMSDSKFNFRIAYRAMLGANYRF